MIVHPQGERWFGIVERVKLNWDWLELVSFHRQNPTALPGDENYFSSVSSKDARIAKIELNVHQGMLLLSSECFPVFSMPGKKWKEGDRAAHPLPVAIHL